MLRFACWAAGALMLLPLVLRCCAGQPLAFCDIMHNGTPLANSMHGCEEWHVNVRMQVEYTWPLPVR